MKFVLALALTGLTAVCAVPAPRCQVGDWGEWSDCKSPKGACIKRESRSYVRSEEERKLEKGRSRMTEMMKRKDAIREYRHKCLAENTCPELQVPPSKLEYTPCVDGFAGEYPCDSVNMFSFTNFADLGFSESGVEGNDIWVWHDTQNGDDYVIMGTTHGSSFVRVTDPSAPEVLGILRTHTFSSTWRDMKVVNDHAYIVSEATGHGMQVFDLTQLRGLSGVDAANMREFSNTAHLDNFGQAHNIASNPSAERVYVIGSRFESGAGVCAGGLHTVDVSDPTNPVTEYCDDIDGYVHDTECFYYNGTDSRYTGRDICFGYNEEDLTIYDADENGNRLISRTGYTGAEYTHQGWATLSRDYLLLDDELDEVYGPEANTKTYIWDIQDLENPVLVSTYYSDELSIDHNQYIVGDYTYQTNYESGLRVLAIDEVASPPTLTQAAYFDCFPSRTTANFFGTWSNYPWLANNAVAVSSIDYGLFMLEVDFAAVEAKKQSDVTLGEQHRYRAALAGSDITECPSLVERRVCVPEEC